MEASIKCCESFGNIRHQFEWFSYQDDKGRKVYIMPYLIACDGFTRLRINYCPTCGKQIREIELK